MALHVRWFDPLDVAKSCNVAIDYYRRAIDFLCRRVESPTFFLFSDDPEAARTNLRLSRDRLVTVSHNLGDEKAYADLWLMALSRHFVTANSTFNWWGAWLGSCEGKVVVTPARKAAGIRAWGFEGLIPTDWVSI